MSACCDASTTRVSKIEIDTNLNETRKILFIVLIKFKFQGTWRQLSITNVPDTNRRCLHNGNNKPISWIEMKDGSDAHASDEVDLSALFTIESKW